MTVNINRSLILSAYKTADQRILFLDYDGTLVPFSDLPGDSKLGDDIRSVLIKLSLDPKNLLYIISGRDKSFLLEQFEGIHVGLIAEHGYRIKEADGNWRPPTTVDFDWKKPVIMLFSEFSDRFKGSFIEEKESAIAYHFRNAEKDLGSKLEPVIQKKFFMIQQKFPALELLIGNKVCEIKPKSFNKGRIASEILLKNNFDFIMGVGDDMTDEQLFVELPVNAFTIKIGTLPTHARFRIPSQEGFIEFLRSF